MANTLKDYREKKGLTQEELAEKAKVPVELIKEIEGEIVILPASQANSISNVLGVEPSKLFDAVGDSDAAATVSEEKEDLNDKLEDYNYLCMASAEKLDALMNTLFQAREGLERLNYDIAEFKMLYTVEIALESIIRDLEQACR